MFKTVCHTSTPVIHKSLSLISITDQVPVRQLESKDILKLSRYFISPVKLLVYDMTKQYLLHKIIVHKALNSGRY